MSENRPVGGRFLSLTTVVAMIFVAAMVVILVKRFALGLGAVTNMNDGYPWGLWIAYDVVVGTAIACGGYAMALLVYVFNRWEYHPLVRPALVASMFGYTLGGLSIIFDVGRYWNAPNLFYLWSYSHFSSVMFEVAFCITLYIIVLWLEFSPAIFEKWGMKGAEKFIKKWMFVVIGIGVLLPTMHQSSLGSLLIIAGQKVHPLWQTTALPLLFLISAIMMGFAVVIFESTAASVSLRRPFETRILSGIAGIMPWFAAAFLVARVVDLGVRGQFGTMFAMDTQSVFFLLETALFIAPMVILFSKANRTRLSRLFLSAFLLLLAGALYRFNAYLIGFGPGAGWHYFPAVGELVVTLGIISLEILGYLLFVRYLPVMPRAEHA